MRRAAAHWAAAVGLPQRMGPPGGATAAAQPGTAASLAETTKAALVSNNLSTMSG